MMSQSYSQKIQMFTSQENIKTRRSKLEVYIDILKELSQRQLRLTHIMQKANINGNVARDSIAFLLKQKLIQKRTLSRSRVYFEINTEGITVLKYFRELEKALPTETENRPRF
jgi:predicted transcriptional regulator